MDIEATTLDESIFAVAESAFTTIVSDAINDYCTYNTSRAQECCGTNATLEE